jgi:hypothetical protein
VALRYPGYIARVLLGALPLPEAALDFWVCDNCPGTYLNTLDRPPKRAVGRQGKYLRSTRLVRGVPSRAPGNASKGHPAGTPVDSFPVILLLTRVTRIKTLLESLVPATLVHLRAYSECTPSQAYA